jgi:radical SAM superfamily enzyme YgiQ (UPF0313 family)
VNITREFLDLIRLPDEKCRKLNYLLVVPDALDGRIPAEYAFLLGIAMVSAAFKASGRNVQTLNLTWRKNPSESLRNAIVDGEIDVVLSGGCFFEFDSMRMIFETAKSVNPCIVTVAGGGLITAESDVAMEALKFVDYGVVGEAEITVNALAYALETGEDLSVLPGIVCRKNGYDYVPFKETDNIDIFPFADYEILEPNRFLDAGYTDRIVESLYNAGSAVVYPRNLTVIFSRSCPFECTFCASHLRKNRRRSIDNIFAELDGLRSKYDFGGLYITDELFTLNKKFVSEFCKRIKGYGLTWSVSARVDTVTEAMLAEMRDAGCVCILYGIESADNDILKSMKKHQTVAQIEHAIQITKKAGIPYNANILYGDVADTRQTIRNSLDWLRGGGGVYE